MKWVSLANLSLIKKTLFTLSHINKLLHMQICMQSKDEILVFLCSQMLQAGCPYAWLVSAGRTIHDTVVHSGSVQLNNVHPHCTLFPSLNQWHFIRLHGNTSCMRHATNRSVLSPSKILESDDSKDAPRRNKKLKYWINCQYFQNNLEIAVCIL